MCKPSLCASQPIQGYSSIEIDPIRLQRLGVTTEKVIERDLTKVIRTVGTVKIDERRIAHIQTKFSGWIEELYVNFVGMPITKDQPLFKVYSQELYSTQEEYLLALKDVRHPIAGRFGKELLNSSKSLLDATKKRLNLWDISSEQVTELEKRGSASHTLLFRSPINGIVLNLNAFIGMNVGPGTNTYTIGDLSYVWVLADIYANDTSFIKLGQKATLTVPSFHGKKFKGTVTFIDYVVETSTRTIKVRFEFDNKDYRLKPGMFTIVKIKLDMGKVLAVPEEAVIDTGKRKIVFVSLGDGKFEPREVQLGFKADAYYQVLSGLSKRETVITSSQFLFDSESRLKALDSGHMKGHGID